MGGHLSAVNLADFEALARERLDAATWAYLAGGAGDEISLRENEAAWGALRLLPRVLQDLAGGHTRCTLLGRRLEHPILLAPVAHQRLFHPDGEAATALAAAAQGAGLVLSAQTSVALPEVARLVRDEPGRGPLWLQVYPHPDTGFMAELAALAATQGFEALVLTVDAALHGVRDRARRAGFTVPPHAQPAHPRPAWQPPPGMSRFDFAAAHAARWEHIALLSRASGLPVLLKGVLQVDDALAALQHGAAGLVVSNHGGRTLDTAVGAVQALPRIAQALGGRLPLLVDGGIRRGTDVLKAIALGADAVLLGRPQAWALAAGGAPGVARLLRLLRDELEIAMALCGCRTLADAPRVLQR